MRGIKTREGGKWKKWAIFTALSLLLILLLNSLHNVYQKKRQAEEALAYMKAELSKLEQRDLFLKDSIQKIETKEGLEFEIRKKLNVAGAGESVAIIVEEKEASSTPPANYSLWQEIKTFVTNIFK